MGTKRTRESAMNDTGENLAVPPGFVSLTAFTLKRMVARQEATNPMAVGVEFDGGIIGAPLSESEIEKFKSSLVHRPWIFCDKSDHSPRNCDTEQTEVDMKDPTSASLPKGVTWGCASCDDCMKVTARWHPEESHLPVINDAPVFHPTEEEFSDTLKYIAKIRPSAEHYGICRIVPPPSWRSPSFLQDKRIWEVSKLDTQVQKIHGLRNFYLNRKLSMLHEKMEAKMPEVAKCGKNELCNDCVVDSKEAKSSIVTSEFGKGPDLSLKSFKKNADNFKRQYFSMNGTVNRVPQQREPLIARIEGEYWRIITSPSEEIEVLCGTNLASQNLGRWFHTSDMAEYPEYVKSGWNLNNIARLPGSLLRFACYRNSVISNPQFFVGMCFASQFWRTEKHHLYSISYMHLGGPKVWYGIPGTYYFKFAEITKKLFPQLSKHPELIPELVSQFSPAMLTSESIPVYRCVQNPLEFVLIFPGAYHSEFSCGFNCSESVCFAPFDWLPHGQHIVELYAGHCLQTSISHDKLLLEASLEAVRAQWEVFVMKNDPSENQLWRSVCAKDGIITKALKARLKTECIMRDHLCNPSQSKALDESDIATKRECCVCLYNLYLSFVSCACSTNRYSCLRHAKQLCSCPWSAKHFYLRYQIKELNLLVEALEGNIKAIHIWAKRKTQPKASKLANAGDQTDAIRSRLSNEGLYTSNGITSDNNLIPAFSNGTSAESRSSPCNTRVEAGLDSLPASSRQNRVTSPPGDAIILVSDDED